MLLDFLSSTAGRVARGGAGVLLIVVGALIGGAGWIVAAIGLVPLAAGIFDLCLLAPLVRRPFRGRDFRASAAH